MSDGVSPSLKKGGAEPALPPSKYVTASVNTRNVWWGSSQR